MSAIADIIAAATRTKCAGIEPDGIMMPEDQFYAIRGYRPIRGAGNSRQRRVKNRTHARYVAKCKAKYGMK